MSELGEDLNVKLKKSNNIDTNNEVVKSIDMEDQTTVFNSKTSNNIAHEENDKDSSLNSSNQNYINVNECSNQSEKSDSAFVIENNCSDNEQHSKSNKNVHNDESGESNHNNITDGTNSILNERSNSLEDSEETNADITEHNDTIVQSTEDTTLIECETVEQSTENSENVDQSTKNSEYVDQSTKGTDSEDDSESVLQSTKKTDIVDSESVIQSTKATNIADSESIIQSTKGTDSVDSDIVDSDNSEEKLFIINGEKEVAETVKGLNDNSNDNLSNKNSLVNSPITEPMDVDSNSLNSTETGNFNDTAKETNALKVKQIKLRSFASLCDDDDDDDDKKPIPNSREGQSPNVTGLSVGDIVEHSNIVEHDKSGVLHLKISDVVSTEESITGILEDDTLSSLQITSVVSLTEPMSPEEPNESSLKIATIGSLTDSSITGEKKTQTVMFYKNRLVVETTCMACRMQFVCKYRVLYKPPKTYIKSPYLCTEKCRDNFLSILPNNHKVEKPTKFFDRLCSMCDKILVSKDIVHWQTREFCDKLCLADHIGEVARRCFECSTAVKVLYMGKYCVRFGSEVRQFCSNHCLEFYKSKIDVCCYCQKNLENVDKIVVQPSKKYCSLMCLKRSQRMDIGQVNYALEDKCTVCQNAKVNMYEFLNNNETVLLCSNPCLSVYKYVNQVKAVNCCMCSRFVNAEEFPNYFYTNQQLRVFCSESCLSVFVITARTVVACQYCKVKKYNFDMIQKSSTDVSYCSIFCLNLMETNRGKDIETVNLDTAGSNSAEQEPIHKKCQMCNKNMPAQFHMVMSDSTLRSFCTYDCANKYKASFGYQVSGINITAKGQGITTEAIVTPKVTERAKKGANKPSVKVDFQALANILKEFEPSEVANKSTSCKPFTHTVGTQNAPFMQNKSVETDENGIPPLVPVPFPVFIPTPMMMYSANVPIPLILPIPVPVPVFIPTTEKTTDDILKRMEKIQNEIPDDPIQAELLLLAKGQEDEMQQQLESQITEEELQTPQMVLEEPDEILNFMDDDEDLSILNDSINKFVCEAPQETVPKKGRKKRQKSYDDDLPESKKNRTDENSDDILNPAYGLSVWIDWVKKKNIELKAKFSGGLINEDLVQISSEAINECLSMFILDLEKTDERAYEIDTIFYLLLGLQKVMFERGSTFCIFLEDRFEKFACTFDKMITRYLTRKFNSEVLGFQMLNGSRITEDMLWQCRQLGAHTPYVLLNTLFYFSTKCFKLRSVEDHMALSFSQVIKQWRRASMVEGSYMRTTLLKYFPRQAHFDKTELEMHENRVDPLKCPVKLYEFYLSKCPESVRSQQGLYYVYPETCCMPDSPVWFSTGPLSALTIERMLHRVQLVKEIQEALYH